MKNLNHLAVIMDGNSRWASSRNLPSKAGHKEGVKKARLAVEYALEKKINYLTLFAFSTENWLREEACLLYTSPSPRDGLLSRMPSSA